MTKNTLVPLCALSLGALLTSCSQTPAVHAASAIDPAHMQRTGIISDRFQSYNIEMIEVTGGRFWKPYKDIAPLKPADGAGNTPAGMSANLYEQRDPTDLDNSRLRKLAAALGPAYVRVSGTWANTAYFQNSDRPAPPKPPEGFAGVLTRRQWKGVVDFAHAADAQLVISFATGAGTRDTAGVWTSAQARQLLDYTKSAGGSIAAAAFMNEPTFAMMGGAPKGYDAAAYARDMKVFVPFMRKYAPATLILGPGGVAEGISLAPPALSRTLLKSDDLLQATGPVFDVFSYHSYPAVSKRCAGGEAAAQTTPEAALSDAYLSRADRIEEFYAGLRDRFEPGKPIWLTETAGAACGGNPWSSTFLDSFRYLDQMARLAQRGVQVHMHNTLASSDYGLLDESTFMPRPNYWAALLWRKQMGATVLNAGPSPDPRVHLYAHCLAGRSGGVALLAINLDRDASHSFEVPMASERYTLSAKQLEDTSVQLNGKDLTLGANDSLPLMNGAGTPAGQITLAPATITFLALAAAKNGSCQ